MPSGYTFLGEMDTLTLRSLFPRTAGNIIKLTGIRAKEKSRNIPSLPVREKYHFTAEQQAITQSPSFDR